MKGNLWQVAVVALVLALVFPALNIAQTDASENTTSETLIIEEGTNSTVSEEADRYGSDPTIESESQTLVEDEDYAWYEDTGTVEWLNSTTTTDGAEATITYTYWFTTEETSIVEDAVLTPLGAVVGLLLLITGVGALFAMIDFGGGSF